MKTARFLISTVAASLALAVVAVVAFAAPGAVGLAASPTAGAAQAVYCPPVELNRRKAVVKRYQRQLAPARKAFFRKTRNAKKRKAFVKKQAAQLKALQRIVKRCN